MTIDIYHNPRCSKSRQTLKLLRDRGYEPRIIEYLETPPSVAELESLLQKLDLSPADIMRTGEAAYKESPHDIAAMTDDRKLQWLADNPKVIQRPIVVHGNRARVGRPPESVLEILS